MVGKNEEEVARKRSVDASCTSFISCSSASDLGFQVVFMVSDCLPQQICSSDGTAHSIAVETLTVYCNGVPAHLKQPLPASIAPGSI